MAQFAVRSVTSIILCGIVYLLLFSFPPWAFSLGVGTIICLALYEFFTMMKQNGVVVYRLFGVTIGMIIPFVVHFQLGYTQSGEVLFLVLACFGLFLLQFPRKDSPKAIEAISLTLFGMMYVSWFLSFLIRIQYLPSGSMLIAYLLVVTKGGDIASYVFGTLWGRHSLIPHISPKKSVEGLFAGVLSSSLLSMLFYGILPFPAGLFHLWVLGLFVGLIGQCGDLSESLIKRYCDAKDSGKTLPGLGGALDVMDSILLTTPLFFFYIKTWG